jgi:hypothetical protein
VVGGWWLVTGWLVGWLVGYLSFFFAQPAIITIQPGKSTKNKSIIDLT